MTSQDFLNFTLAGGIIIMTLVFSYTLFMLVRTMNLLISVLADLDKTTKSLLALKGGIKLGALSLVGKVLDTVKKGGESNE